MTDLPFERSHEYDDIAEHVHVDYAFASNFLEPIRLTAQLEIEPSRDWTTGEQYVSKAWNPQTRAVYNRISSHPWGVWGIDTKALSAKDPEVHLTHLLNLLEPKRSVIQSYLDEPTRFIVRFHIWWEPYDCHGGYSISANLLMRAATLCHHIDFGFISKPSQTESTSEPEHVPNEPT